MVAMLSRPQCVNVIGILNFYFGVCSTHLWGDHVTGSVFPGPWFNIKMLSYQYRKSHCGDKTVVRSSYLHNGISYSGKTTSLYWIRALNYYYMFTQNVSVESVFITFLQLTRWGRMTHICANKLVRHCLRKWLVACLPASHYLDHCWLLLIGRIFNEIWIQIQQSASAKMHSEMGSCTMVVILSQLHCISVCLCDLVFYCCWSFGCLTCRNPQSRCYSANINSIIPWSLIMYFTAIVLIINNTVSM